MTLTKATYSMIDGAPVNILDYGADPTGLTDSSAAIQAAIDASKSIFIPAGTYLIGTMIEVTDYRFSIIGVRGKSILKAAGNNAILGPSADFRAEYAHIYGLTFTSAVAGQGTGIYTPGPTDSWYVGHWTIDECSFEGQLAYGIRATLIASVVTRCDFGLFNPGPDFVAIESIGQATPTLRETNINVISGCEFAFCNNADYVVKFKYGLKTVFENTVFERNEPNEAIIHLEGIAYPIINNCWFELNVCDSLVKFSQFSSQDVYVATATNCIFNTSIGPATAVFDFDNTANKNLVFKENLVGLGAVPLTTANVKLIEESGNFSTNSSYSALPTDKSFFAYGIETATAQAEVFTSASASANIGTSATTIYTFPSLSQTGCYLVSYSCYRDDAANYSGFAVVGTDLTTARLIQNSTQTGITATLSGLNLQIATNSVTPIPVVVRITRVG
jgi:hypothetical protein